MGTCCCRPPDDDDENVEKAKPVNDGLTNGKGNYGSIKENTCEIAFKGLQENSKEDAPAIKEPGSVKGEENKHAEGLDAASEATPLLDSSSAPQQIEGKTSPPPEDSEDFTSAETVNPLKKQETPASNLEKESGATSDIQLLPAALEGQGRPSNTQKGSSEGASSHQTTPEQHPRSATSESSSDIPARQVRSVSDEVLDEPGSSPDTKGYKKEKKGGKSVGNKIKKKLGKFGEKRKSSKSGGESSSETTETRSRAPSDPAKSDSSAPSKSDSSIPTKSDSSTKEGK